MSEKLTWTPLDDAAQSMTAANRLAFLPQTFFWPCNLPQERYNSLEPVPKREIPAQSRDLPHTPGACQVHVTMIRISGSIAEIVGEKGGGRRHSVEKSKSGTFPLRLEIPQERRDSHFFHRPGGRLTLKARQRNW